MFQKPTNNRHSEPAAIAAEQLKMQRLKALVDLTSAVLYQSNYTVAEGYTIISNCKKAVLELFPENEHTFDLIYKPRFERIVHERFVER
jgi:hypothetical protein